MKNKLIFTLAPLLAAIFSHHAAADSAPPPAPVAATAKAAPAFSGKTIGKFAERVAALYAYDLDKDGTAEIIAGFDTGVAVFKLENGVLRKVARHDTGPRSQVTGVCAGDFSGEGEPEIFVNKIAGTAARGEILSFNGRSLDRVQDELKYFFICGANGKLYRQGQRTDGALRDEVMAVEWTNQGMGERPFTPLPEQRRLSGLSIFDIDGDGAMDVAGFDMNRKLVYHSGAGDEWTNVDGEFGGSDITIRLTDEAEAEIHHEIQPAMVPMASSGKFPLIVAPQNQYTFTLLSATRNYVKSRILAVENKGLGYEVTASTPVVDGVINAIVPFGKNSFIAARSQKGLMGGTKSEILLLTVEGF
ncbi:MAG: VCBS repeat-containing protein [Nitrospinae bacterium]|nr:VCBS repeat-containing protein [Nitrospinota bacterium]